MSHGHGQDVPGYAQPIIAYLLCITRCEALRDRLKHQRAHDLPGDQETVALCLTYWDEHYRFSDDLSAWRRGHDDEKWLVKNDQWFQRDVPFANRHLLQKGLVITSMGDGVTNDNALRLKAFRRGISDVEWSQVILPVENAIRVLDEYELPRSEVTHTLPTSAWVGDRDRKVLVVPRRVRNAAEQIRTGMNAAVEKGIELDIWTGCHSKTTPALYYVSSGRFAIWPNKPTAVRGGAL